jgi:hypothetical protein
MCYSTRWNGTRFFGAGGLWNGRLPTWDFCGAEVLPDTAISHGRRKPAAICQVTYHFNCLNMPQDKEFLLEKLKSLQQRQDELIDLLSNGYNHETQQKLTQVIYSIEVTEKRIGTGFVKKHDHYEKGK